MTTSHFGSHTNFHGRQFSSVCGTYLGDSVADFPVREGYAVKEGWVLTSTGTADGWLYSRAPGSTSWSATPEVGMGWRRRTWCRVLERNSSLAARVFTRLSRGLSAARRPTVGARESSSPVEPPTVEMAPRVTGEPTGGEEPPTTAHAVVDEPAPREAERTSGEDAVVSNPVLDKGPPVDRSKPTHPPSASRSVRKAAAKATGMHGFFSKRSHNHETEHVISEDHDVVMM